MVILLPQNYTIQTHTPIFLNWFEYTYFECKNWRSLCKAYAFEPDMLITCGIRPEDDIKGNIDIWGDVQTPPVLPLCEFLNHIYVFDIVYSKIVDN